MKRFSEQLYKKAGTVKLRAAEKRELRERVVSYMEYHPLPKEMQQVKTVKTPELLTEDYKEVSVPFKMLARWAIGVAAIVIIAVPFAAERSVPGDGLYAVKRFNEDVRGTLAFNTVQKVEWETTLLNRRIAEARLLESEGRLTDEVEAVVAEAVRTHSDNAQKSIEVLRAQDEDEATLASIAFETTLAVQSAALSEDDEIVDAETGEELESEEPSLLAAVVEESLEATNATNASSTIPAFDKVMAKVERNTTRVYELRDSLALTATGDQTAEITRRIEDIERSVGEAIALRDEDDEAARAILVDSLQRTQKLIVFMTDIEVSQAVDIEEIVPVVLTPEEETVIINDLATGLSEKLETITNAVAETEDEEVIAKVESVLITIETLQTALAEAETFLTAEAAGQEAHALADNLLTVLEIGALEAIELSETASSTDAVLASSTDEIIEEDTEVEGEEPTETEENDATTELEEVSDNTASTTEAVPTSEFDTVE